MATVRTTCPDCNDAEFDVPAESILLQWREDIDAGSYSFLCPGCDHVQEKETDDRVAKLLLVAGASYMDP